jgi:hypothetical protein
LKLNYAGCALCDSTWGDVWEEVDGERTFFCCATCAVQFRNLVARIQKETGWSRIDALELSGGRRGRACLATSDHRSFRARFVFNSEGGLLSFEAAEPG